eukprot:706214-Rhodomonas_salina.3
MGGGGQGNEGAINEDSMWLAFVSAVIAQVVVPAPRPMPQSTSFRVRFKTPSQPDGVSPICLLSGKPYS